jgi:hypothetical protein
MYLHVVWHERKSADVETPPPPTTSLPIYIIVGFVSRPTEKFALELYKIKFTVCS